MTLVEFLVPLRTASQREKVLATLFFLQRYKGEDALTVDEIRTALRQARVSGAASMNIARALATAGHYVDGEPSGGRNRWRLTSSGETFVRERLGLPDPEPAIEHDVMALTKLASKITDENVREYVDEAIKCLRAGALRAAIVFIWTAAIRTLHERAIQHGAAVADAAVKKQDPKARDIKTADDFAYVKDRKFLDATPDIGILDKGEKDTMVEALNVRNRCGHPTKYRPGEAKAKGFIEDVVGIVWR